MVRSPLPVISVEGVRQALANLIRSPGAASRHPLSALTLVDELLLNTDFPRTENLQGFALNQIITDAIKQEFQRLRQIHHLPELVPDLPLQDELKRIQADAHRQVPALIIWGYLYYRYVRYELHLSPERYADLIGLDKRTMQRYLQRGVEVLTHILTIREGNARQRLRRQRLLTALPHPRAVTLFGRDDLFQQAEHALAERSPRHFLISGAPGSGKSIFVSEWLRRRIEMHPDEAPETLLWVHHPESIEHILQEMSDRMLPENAAVDLRDYLARHTFLLVVDGIEQLQLAELEYLLSYLTGAELILIGYEYLALKNPVTHLRMRDFTPDECRAYLVFLLNTTSSDHSLDSDRTNIANTVNPDSIITVTGRNPLAMKLAIELMVVEGDEAAIPPGMNNIYRSYFDALPPDLQAVWAAFSLIPETGISTEHIQTIWGKSAAGRVSELSNRYLIDRLASDHITLKPSVRAFIEGSYHTTDYVEDLVNRQFEIFQETWQNNPHIPDLLSCIEQILYADFLPLDPELEQYWLYALLNHADKNPVHWLAILAKRFQRHQLNHELLIEFGRNLRRFHQWQRAQFVLEQAVLAAGQKGDFAAQGLALTELAVLFRIHHRLDQAEQVLDRAYRTVQRLSDTSLLIRIRLELAQLAIERQDGSTALEWLAPLPESERVLLLMAEAYLLLQNEKRGLEAALQALRFTRTDELARNINFVLLGRLYISLQNFEQAHDYLSTAVTRLEQMNQPLELSRALTNLAVTLIHLGNIRQAKQLLTQAERLQREIHDVVGLATTQYNLNWLKTHPLPDQSDNNPR